MRIDETNAAFGQEMAALIDKCVCSGLIFKMTINGEASCIEINGRNDDFRMSYSIFHGDVSAQKIRDAFDYLCAALAKHRP